MKYWILIFTTLFLTNCNITKNKATATQKKSTVIYRNKPATTQTANKKPERIIQPTKRLYYYAILLNRFKTKTEADNLASRFKQQFPSRSVTIRYETPNYKVYTGIYNTEKEADNASLKLRSNYPSAFSVQFKN